MTKKSSLSAMATPNDEQASVINFTDGVASVQAGPGSGKTFVLTQRYARLIQEGLARPEDILCLTFTNSSAKSMRSRAEEIVAIPEVKRTSGWMTFHSLALAFTLQERDQYPFKLAEFPLAADSLVNRAAFDAAKRHGVEPKPLKAWMSLQKRSGLNPAQALAVAETEGKNEKYALAYKEYESTLQKVGVLDFDSLIKEMHSVLTLKEDVRKRWQYKYIQVDEAQDCDRLQWFLLNLLSPRNLMVVGDAGQCLYSFRGSSSQDFLELGDLLGRDIKKFFLGRNHRSSASIVSMVKKVSPYEELAARFEAVHPEGAEPTITGYLNDTDEAQAIVEFAEANPKAEVAVLARTNRALRAVEDALSVANIKYHLLGKSGFWQQKEVQAVVAYLQCVYFPSDWAIPAAIRAPFWPSQYMKKSEICADIKALLKSDPSTSAHKILQRNSGQEAISKFVRFLDGLRKHKDLPCQKIVTNILQDLNAFDHYSSDHDPDNDPVSNLQDLVKIAKRFDTLKDFLDFIRRASAAARNRKGVCLSTVHSSKGLEWFTVFLIAVNDGVLPHSKSDDLPGEKNVFYVGVSRAKKDLRLSYSGVPSPFLKPLMEEKNEVV